MANIHEQLYQSHSFSNLSFDQGLQTLVRTILDTMDHNLGIQTTFELEPIELNIKQAIPCSLIVNEVITNSLKHAFSNQSDPKIAISLSNNAGNIFMQIKDNGSGFKEKQTGRTSLGMELISTLALQLDADYKYESRKDDSGTVFELKFSELSAL